MKKLYYIIIVLPIVFNIASAQSTTVSAETQNALNKIERNFFIENKGQWHPDVLFLARMGGLDVWITKYGLNYTFFKLEEVPSPQQNERRLPDKFEHKDYILLGHRVLMKLQGHNESPVREGKEKLEGYYNYFIGNDPSKYASFVGLYKEAIVKDVYKGIDIRYYFDKGSLRYDYIVHPGTDPSKIVFNFEGSDKTYINSQGNLVFATRFGEVAIAELKTYQEKDKKEIKSYFVQKNEQWGIALGSYDRTQALIIDPLIYSTYLGGNDIDEVRGITIDCSGNTYVTGYTRSTNYDVTPGAFQTKYGGYGNAFVTKLNASGSDLVYSTYLGGSKGDDAYGIAIDGNGNAYVTGFTHSDNFPVTQGAFQTKYGKGKTDAFVTKLNASGSDLVYSTYLGGSVDDEAYGIATDSSGNAYVTGWTNSGDFDVTPGAFQTKYEGQSDVFVTKLNASGSGLVYSTYLGGSGYDIAYGIAIDSSGNAYVTGLTNSGNYDVTPGAFQTKYGGGPWDVFVTKLNASGSDLVYSTYLGGSGDDRGYGIAIDVSGNAYVTGYTGSTDYDVTPRAFQTTKGGFADVFVTKLNASGSGLAYSTYLGGKGDDFGWGVAVDISGNAYVTGYTGSTDYDVTPRAFQTTIGGAADVFVTKLNASGSGLVYSTYIGGSGNDRGFGIVIDVSGYPYVTGFTNSTDFIVTPGAFQTAYGGGGTGFSEGGDVFVLKLCIVSISLSSGEGTDHQKVCINTPIPNITYTTTGAIGATFSGLPPGVYGSFANDIVTISGIPTDTGTFNFTIMLMGKCGNETANGTIIVKPDNTITLTSDAGTDNQTVCINTPITNITYTTTGAKRAKFSGLPPGVTGNYSRGKITISGIPTESGTFNYTIMLTDGCGNVTANGTITVKPNIPITLTSATGTDNQTVCINTPITNITYTTTGATGATFSDLPPGVIGNYADGNITISGIPTASGTFNYSVTLKGTCGNVMGSITVKPNNTITLTSDVGTDNQTVCINTPITNITYTTTGATGAMFRGLPAGITGNFEGDNITISGIPTVSGTFNYTITLTGGCGKTTAMGNITVIGCPGIEVPWYIFPNPTTGIFILQTKKGGVFELIDISGKVIQTYNVQNPAEQIQVDLPCGVYFIRETKSGYTQKLVIE